MVEPNVLLIDDEEELVSALVERLLIRGVHAKAVTNGHEAVEMFAEEKFDVVVVDLKMPGLGGLEIVELIRERYPQMKVILITGHGSDKGEAIQPINGVFHTLLKPFSIKALVQKINEALQSGSGGA